MDPLGNPQRADSLPAERRLSIVAELDSGNAVRADDLARRFGVSAETIRRDLLRLERQGLVRRVHGGAVRPVSRAFEPPYEERRVERLTHKQAMARQAAALVDAGNTVVFDVGTSVAEVARALDPDLGIRALTCSLLVASELGDRPNVELMVSGGRVRRGDLACSGPVTEAFFADFYADLAFLGSGGVHPEAGLTDYHLNEIAVRRLIIDRARETYVLADSSKIGHVAVGRVCPLESLTGVITDAEADPDALTALEKAGIEVLVAPMEAQLSVTGASSPAM